MAVLLGGLGSTKTKSYTQPDGFTNESYVTIHRFIDYKKLGNSKFYVVYHLAVDGRFKTATSPIFNGLYKNGLFVKEITKWVKSINQDPKAQYSVVFFDYDKISSFKRGYQAKGLKYPK